MHGCVSLYILNIYIGSQLYQGLNIFNVKPNRCKVQGSCSFIIFGRDFYFMDPLKEENSSNAIIALCGTMVYCLVAVISLSNICIKRQTEGVDDMVIAGCCCEMDRLTA